MPGQKVLDWIKKTGFPLEMEAASAFRSAGFEIRQSYSYPDPQSDKGREIDVLAMDPDWIGIIEISFVIECKSSNKPWIVLTSEDALENYNQLFAFAVTSEAAKIVLVNKLTNLGKLEPFIKKSSKNGYGFRQAFSENNDPAYTAAIGVIKACVGVASERNDSTLPNLSFVFPVIVIDSPLFECSIKGNGELVLEEVEESEFLFSAYVPNHAGTCIKVIKKGQLRTFAKKAKVLAEALRAELKNEEDAALR